MSTLPHLHISILGPPAITLGAEPLLISRLQNRAFLYRLAAQSEPVGRDHLCFLFWPDVSNDKARRNLTQLLSHVRASLPHPGYILTTKEHILLDPTSVSSDAVAFEALAAAGDIGSLGQAVALYREALLSGVSMPDNAEYEAWLSGARYHFEKRLLSAIDRLVEEAHKRNEVETMIELANRYLRVDELAEEMHRQLIEAYAASGNRSAALRQYEQCVVVLERELGVEPLPDTQATYRAILAGTGKPATETADAETVWATTPGINAPMVGREESIQQLATAFRRVQTGLGQMALVGGEAGIGKSRLLQEFAATMRDQVQLIMATCHSNIQSMPYQALVEALRPHLQRKEVALAVSATWRNEAAHLFPELATGGAPGRATTTDDAGEQGRGRLFEALRLLLDALTVGTLPLVLFLEDLQWADTAMIEWLLYLARQLRRSRILVIGTYRNDEAAPVDELRWEIGRLRAGSDLQLPPLTLAEVKTLVSHLTMATPSDLPRRLWQATGGNPFFLLEIVRDLSESKELATASPPAALPISATLRETVQRRLRHLQPLSRQVLEAASVWGASSTFDLLRQSAGRSETETVDALDELMARSVLVGAGEEIRFHHEIIRAVVYAGLSRWRRLLLHRRVAEILEARLPLTDTAARASQVAQIGHHFAEAEEIERAVTYLLEAGDHARNLYDDQAALVYYERSLSLQRQHDDPTRAARTLMKIGLTHHSALDFNAARAAYDEGFALHQRALEAHPSSNLPPAPHPLRVVSLAPATRSLDPALVEEIFAGTILHHLFRGLVMMEPNMDVVPDIARSWEVLDGGHSYRFILRDDVFWSDGVLVTAHDFVYAWQRALDPARQAPRASVLFDLRGARAFHRQETADATQLGFAALDDRTLLLHLEEPTGYFLQLLSYSIALPVPRHCVEAHGAQWHMPEHIVSNGPFLLHSRSEDGSLCLLRNSTFYGRFGGNVHEVLFMPHHHWNEKLQAYQRNEIDGLSLFYPPTPESHRARRDLASDYLSAPQMSSDIICFNVTQPPLDNIHMRQALAMAIDKEQLAYVAMQGYALPASGGFVPPGIPGHLPENPLLFDPKQARKLLAAALGAHAPAIELTIPRILLVMGEFLQQQWRIHLGLEVKLRVVEWADFVPALADCQMFFCGWLGDYPDPDSWLGKGPVQLLDSWHDEIYEWLAEQAKQSQEQRERLQLYQQMDQMLMEEAIVVPLAYGRSHVLLKPWVKNFVISPMMQMFWHNVIIEPH